MITTNSDSCKYHGEKMKRTCPGCLTVEITRLRKERNYWQSRWRIDYWGPRRDGK